jgi:hypothetical protein
MTHSVCAGRGTGECWRRPVLVTLRFAEGCRRALTVPGGPAVWLRRSEDQGDDYEGHDHGTVTAMDAMRSSSLL